MAPFFHHHQRPEAPQGGDGPVNVTLAGVRATSCAMAVLSSSVVGFPEYTLSFKSSNFLGAMIIPLHSHDQLTGKVWLLNIT